MWTLLEARSTSREPNQLPTADKMGFDGERAMCSPREERYGVLERQSVKCACMCGGIARTRVTVGWPELLDPAVAGWGEPR